MLLHVISNILVSFQVGVRSLVAALCRDDKQQRGMSG
jgi:hypothetical protein